MAIFRKGVKLGKGGMNDVRVSLLSKQRAKGLLRKAKILDDGRGRKQFETDARGEVDLYRRAVTRAEGFQNPAQFKITFQSGQKIHWLYGCIIDKQQYFHPRKFDRDYTSTKL